MSKLEKIDRELEKAREKAAEWQAKIKDLEKQRQEEENNMDTSFLSSIIMPSITSPFRTPFWSSSLMRWACEREGADCWLSMATAIYRWFLGLI